MSEPTYHVGQELDPGRKEAVFSVLREHNRVHNSGYWAATEKPENAPRPLSVVAVAEDGNVLGGVTGSTQLSWLRLDVLGVREGSRGRGVGRRLVTMAEEEAVRRGCRHAFADTMEHQSPGFFQRLGYGVVGKLDDWDSHGQSKFLLVKRLVESGPR
jgi:GNAT superfamily N-acetyltransferase